MKTVRNSLGSWRFARYRPGWDTHDRLPIEHIFDDRGPGSDDAVVADFDAGDDDGSDADKGAVTDFHLPGQSRTGRDVDAVAQDAVMVDTGSGVDDPADANHGVCLNDRTGHDDGPTGQSGCGRHGRSRMDQSGDKVPLAKREF